MKGNFHVQFLGGWGAVMLPGYPARMEKEPSNEPPRQPPTLLRDRSQSGMDSKETRRSSNSEVGCVAHGRGSSWRGPLRGSSRIQPVVGFSQVTEFSTAASSATAERLSNRVDIETA